jgi:hypothetical protein
MSAITPVPGKGFVYAGRAYPSFGVADEIRKQNAEIIGIAERMGAKVDHLLKQAVGATSSSRSLRVCVEQMGPLTRLELLRLMREEASRA